MPMRAQRRGAFMIPRGQSGAKLVVAHTGSAAINRRGSFFKRGKERQAWQRQVNRKREGKRERGREENEEKAGMSLLSQLQA